MTRPTASDIPRLQRALIRLLWDSIADEATEHMADRMRAAIARGTVLP